MSETGEGEVAAGEVDGDEPGGDEINEMVEKVGVRDAVSSGIECEEEEEEVGDVADTCSNRQHVDVSEYLKNHINILGGNPGYHLPAGQGFDQKDKGHY